MTAGPTSTETTATPSDPEDVKIITLARSALARTSAPQGACVRDTDGRTYAAATVDLPSLRLTAIQVCLGMAVSSGAKGLEAAVLLTEADEPTAPDLAGLTDLGGRGVVVHVGDPRGTLRDTRTT